MSLFNASSREISLFMIPYELVLACLSQILIRFSPDVTDLSPVTLDSFRACLAINTIQVCLSCQFKQMPLTCPLASFPQKISKTTILDGRHPTLGMFFFTEKNTLPSLTNSEG